MTNMAAPGRTRSLRTVQPFLIGLVGIFLLAIVNQVRGFDLWRNYALTGFTEGLIVIWIFWRWDVRFPAYIQGVIVTAVLLHYGGGSLGSPDPYQMGPFGFHGINGAYHTFDWWDHLTHAFGIGAGTMAAAYLLEIYQTRRRLEWAAGSVWLLAVLAGLALGVGVELAEYLGKSAFHTIDQGGYENTMRDLQFNVYGSVLGGGVAATLDRRRLTQRIQSYWGRSEPVTPVPGWLPRLPPAMAGLIAFLTPPAAMTLVLAVRFFLQAPPADDAQAYDDGLHLLLWSAIAGAALGPGVALAWRKRTTQEDAT